VQETYARVLSRTRWLRDEDEVGYPMRAMRNTLASQRRTAARRPQTAPFDDDSPLGAPASDDPAGAAEAAEVYSAIAELPDDYRDALVAVDVSGLSYQEAARVLGVPEGTVFAYSAMPDLSTRTVWPLIDLPLTVAMPVVDAAPPTALEPQAAMVTMIATAAAEMRNRFIVRRFVVR
jgi:Sigma-70, region 4